MYASFNIICELLLCVCVGICQACSARGGGRRVIGAGKAAVGVRPWEGAGGVGRGGGRRNNRKWKFH